MVDVNEYFDGKVKSFVVSGGEKKKTVGVMNPGEYEFNTASAETMTIIAGEMAVLFPDETEWEEFGEGGAFDVPANSQFKVKVSQDTAYLCEYE